MPPRMPLMSFGLLLLRISIGGLMLVHGVQKIQAFEKLKGGFPDPLGMGHQLSLISAIGSEVGCSILLFLGLGTRLAAMPLAFTMIIAHFVIHAKDPWQAKELSAVYLCVYAALIFTGAGQFSLDHLLWKRKSGETPSKVKN